MLYGISWANLRMLSATTPTYDIDKPEDSEIEFAGDEDRRMYEELKDL